MNRRDFLKAVGLAAVCPSLPVEPEGQLTVKASRGWVDLNPSLFRTPLYVALEDIAEGEWGWVQVLPAPISAKESL